MSKDSSQIMAKKKEKPKIELSNLEDIIHGYTPLVEIYKQTKGQGCSLNDSEFIFLGLDAIFANVDNQNQSFFDRYVIPYLSNYQFFLESNSYTIHHPFLLEEYNKGKGTPYHKNFRTLHENIKDEEKRKRFLSTCNFSELVPYPTFLNNGRKSKYKYVINYKELLKEKEVLDHINSLFLNIFEGKTPKVLFINPSFAHSFPSDYQNWELNAHAIEIIKLAKSLEKKKEYYKASKIGVHTIYMTYHFSYFSRANVDQTLLNDHANLILDHLD